VPKYWHRSTTSLDIIEQFWSVIKVHTMLLFHLWLFQILLNFVILFCILDRMVVDSQDEEYTFRDINTLVENVEIRSFFPESWMFDENLLE
jgi:hypothetical protein